MKTGSYRCLLGSDCRALAIVQIRDADGSETRGCFPDAYDALKNITGAKVVWAKTKVANEFAWKALELTENPYGIKEEQHA